MKKRVVLVIVAAMLLSPSCNVFASIDDAQNAFSDLISGGNTVQVSEVSPYDGCKILQVIETINPTSDNSTDFIYGVTDKIKEIAQADWFDYERVYQDIYCLDKPEIKSSSIYDFSNGKQYFSSWGDNGFMAIYDIATDEMVKQTNILGDCTVPEESSEDSAISDSDGSTLSQQNALDAASTYLNISSFSYSGLIQQLEFEQYTEEDATYAADHCGANWNEQAAKSAQSYLDNSSFSRDGLIQQLKFDGFTDEQAEYGASAVGY